MRERNAKDVVIKLIDGSIIKGKTNIGDQRRLSDRLNREEGHFLIVFEVSMEGEHEEVILINKRQILWVMPFDE